MRRPAIWCNFALSIGMAILFATRNWLLGWHVHDDFLVVAALILAWIITGWLLPVFQKHSPAAS